MQSLRDNWAPPAADRVVLWLCSVFTCVHVHVGRNECMPEGSPRSSSSGAITLAFEIVCHTHVSQLTISSNSDSRRSDSFWPLWAPVLIFTHTCAHTYNLQGKKKTTNFFKKNRRITFKIVKCLNRHFFTEDIPVTKRQMKNENHWKMSITWDLLLQDGMGGMRLCDHRHRKMQIQSQRDSTSP